MKYIDIGVGILSLLPFIIGLIRYKSFPDRLVFVFFCYCTGILLIEGIAQTLNIIGMTNMIVYNFFLVISFLLIAFIAYQEKFSWWKWFFIPGWLIVVFMHLRSAMVFDQYYYLFVFASQSVISAMALLKLVDYEDNLFENPRFWIYSGLLIYGFTSVCLNLLWPASFSENVGNLTWSRNYQSFFNFMLTLITYSLFSRAFYVTARL